MKLKYWWRWEFWPYWLFYIPIYFYGFYLAMRARSLTFFTSSNPGIEHGGFVDYSKIRILQHIDKKYLPKTTFIDSVADKNHVLAQMAHLGIDFPVILKPDKGERGWLVSKIQSEAELTGYLARGAGQLLLQEFIPHRLEYGIMYARLPGAQRGKITSVVIKEQLAVRGDGSASIRELCARSKRCRYHWEMIAQRFESLLATVPARDEVVTFVEIGTHRLGATFRNGNHLISTELVDIFDRISARIPGYFIGRYDVKASSFDELLQGNFKIIELNGANSEPTHIYDPDNTLSQAYRDLFAHWTLLAKIGRLNRQRGHQSSPVTLVASSVLRHLSKKRRLESQI